MARNCGKGGSIGGLALENALGWPRASAGTEPVVFMVQTFLFIAPSPSARNTERAIIRSSSVRMTRTATRLASVENYRLVATFDPADHPTLPQVACFDTAFQRSAQVLSTAPTRLALRLGTGGQGQKLLPTVVAAKVEGLSITFGAESRCFVHGHSADGVFGHGLRFFHGHVSFLFFHCPLIPVFTLFRVNRKFLFSFFSSLVISSVSAIARRWPQSRR